MNLTRMLRQKGNPPDRASVAKALDREMTDRPDRSYGDVLRGLNRQRDGSGAGAAGAEEDTESDDGEAEAEAEAGERELRTRRTAGGGGGGGGGEREAGGKGSGREAGGEAGKSDKKKKPSKLPIKLKISTARTVTGGLNPGGDAFGLMTPTFTFTGISHKVGKKHIVVSATLNCAYQWGVHGLGNIDVPKADAAFITATNYKEVADDLDPDLGTVANSAAYSKYWSKKATEKHELEHVREDWQDFVPKKGKAAAKAAFETGKKIKIADADATISTIATKAGPKVFKASDKHYGIPASYHARAGEIKAHAVGAKVERPLAQGIRKHGKKLVKAEAKRQKKLAKTAGAGAEAAVDTPPTEAEAPEGGRGRRRGAEFNRTVSRLMGMFD